MPEDQLHIEIGKRVTEIVDFVVDGKSRQLAIRLGIDPSQLAKIQKGQKGLTIEKAVELSTKYNISLDWLLAGRGEKFVQEKSGASQQPDHDLLTVLGEETEIMRLSLERLTKAASETHGSYTPKVPGPKPVDLGLGKKAGSRKTYKQKDTGPGKGS